MNPSLSRPRNTRLASTLRGRGAQNAHSAMDAVAAVIVAVVMGAVVASGAGVEALAPPGTGAVVEALAPPEIKTQAPIDPSQEPVTHKDCRLYDEGGVLKGHKRHGETWDNDEAKCARCFCHNGEKRCYYHYCNDGLIEEYMTPPSTESHHPPEGRLPRVGPGGWSVGVPPDDESEEEESSGVDPDDFGNPFFSKFSKNKTPKEPGSAGWEGQRTDLDLGQERTTGEKDPWDNETYDDRHDDDLYYSHRHQECQDSCKNKCAHGFEVDAENGCSSCKCFKCPPLDTCTLKCPHGFVHDTRLCRTCKCGHAKYVDKDKYKPAKEEGDGKPGKDNHDDKGMTTKTVGMAETKLEKDSIELEDSAWSTTQEPSTFLKAQEEPTPKAEPEDAGFAKGDLDVDPTDPLCDLTKRQGCMDGAELHSVGAIWSPSPCVMCRCVTPDYKECNVTQCAPLTCQPHRQLTPPQSCCPICADTPQMQAHEQYPNDSHSTSRVPEGLVSTRLHKAYESGDIPSQNSEGEKLKGVPAGNGTLRSALPGSSEFWWWQLFVPMAAVAVVASIVTAVVVYVWRRYHRDKYYITAGRPDETERLRPVPVRTVENGHLIKQV